MKSLTRTIAIALFAAAMGCGEDVTAPDPLDGVDIPLEGAWEVTRFVYHNPPGGRAPHDRAVLGFEYTVGSGRNFVTIEEGALRVAKEYGAGFRRKYETTYADSAGVLTIDGRAYPYTLSVTTLALVHPDVEIELTRRAPRRTSTSGSWTTCPPSRTCRHSRRTGTSPGSTTTSGCPVARRTGTSSGTPATRSPPSPSTWSPSRPRPSTSWAAFSAATTARMRASTSSARARAAPARPYSRSAAPSARSRTTARTCGSSPPPRGRCTCTTWTTARSWMRSISASVRSLRVGSSWTARCTCPRGTS